jgi:molybdopterin molybdotransferase
VSGVPRVRVFVTGDEVVPLGAPLRLGEVPDANGPLVAAHLARWGITDVTVEHLVDDADRVRTALDQALSDADLVITTGGVSVGDYDFIPSACEAVGAKRVFWKVAQKPGMPLFVAERDGCLLMGLPGNPGAVLVNLHVYVRHAIDRMVGSDPARRWHQAASLDGLRRETNKTFWLRATAGIDARGVTTLRPLRGQASHMLANLAVADALVRVPGEHESTEGVDVAWTRLTQ